MSSDRNHSVGIVPEPGFPEKLSQVGDIFLPHPPGRNGLQVANHSRQVHRRVTFYQQVNVVRFATELNEPTAPLDAALRKQLAQSVQPKNPILKAMLELAAIFPRSTEERFQAAMVKHAAFKALSEEEQIAHKAARTAEVEKMLAEPRDPPSLADQQVAADRLLVIGEVYENRTLM